METGGSLSNDSRNNSLSPASCALILFWNDCGRFNMLELKFVLGDLLFWWQPPGKIHHIVTDFFGGGKLNREEGLYYYVGILVTVAYGSLP